MSHNSLNYKAVDSTIAAFHASTKPISGIRAGRGTGKSVATQMQIFVEAMRMPPCADKVRRSRWLITRSSYRDLEMSALRTYEALTNGVPGFLPIRGREPYHGGMNMSMPDGTHVEAEIVFMATAPDDLIKLRSMEYTGALINEIVTYPSIEIVSAVMASCSRYPSKSMFDPEYVQEQERRGLPPYVGRVLYDTNGCSRDHWFAKISDLPPDTWDMFVQEAPLIEVEEPQSNGVTVHNVHYAPNPKCQYAHIQAKSYRYWLDILPGSTDEYINASVLGHFSDSVAGKRVYPEFQESMVSKKVLDPKDFEGCRLVIGCDSSGNHPAACVTTMKDGVFYVLDEVGDQDIAFQVFVDDFLIPLMASKYADFDMKVVCDPSNPMSGIDKRTAMGVLLTAGFEAELASTNFTGDRLESVKKRLNKRDGFVISPNCEMLLGGFRGRYKYTQVRGKVGVHKTTPDKSDAYADYADSLQYSSLGWDLIRHNYNSEPVTVRPSQRRAV